MKKIIRNIFILLVPFLLMILVNEMMRNKIKEKPYSTNSFQAMNSAEYFPNKCSWACHNNTSYCKANHVKFLKSYFSFTDKPYFGIIGALKSTNNYRAANIFFLVFLLPFIFLILIIKSFNLQDQIREKLKSKL